MEGMAVAPEARGLDTAEALFEAHSGWVYGYCLRMLRSPEEAEDALQTTYLNACRSLNQGTLPRVGSAWLLRIAQNVCFTRLRSSGRRSTVERPQDIAVLEETVAAPDRAHDDLVGLTDALLAMPERQRKAILLREWQGLTYEEIAAELEISHSAVETLIFRARRSLAAGLEAPPKRSRLRSVLAVDFAGILAAIKGLFAGSAGVKAAAALTVVAATTTVVAADPVGVLDRERTRLAPAPAAGVPAASTVAPAPLLGAPSRPSVVSDDPSFPRGDATGKAKAKKDGKPAAPGSNGNGHGSANGNGYGHANGNAARGNGNAQAPGQLKEPGTPAQGKGGGPAGAAKSAAGGNGPPPHAKTPEKAKKGKAAD
jgi:RNA polymerase sigma factor (sigma-70 family)